MFLAIDIGNTNIKIGIFDKKKLIGSFRLSSVVKRTSDEYGNDIISQLQRILSSTTYTNNQIKGIVISSVNPNLNYTFERLSEYYFDTTPIFVSPSLQTKIDYSLYQNQIGADRIANCEGAINFFHSSSLIVIDCGTATSFNCIQNGKFVGGAIMPGLRTAANSLSNAAAQLANITLDIPSTAIGITTTANMQSGILYGHIGAIEYLVNKMKQELSSKTKVIATGGLSEFLSKGTSVFDTIDRTLILTGLIEIYQNNTTNIFHS